MKTDPTTITRKDFFVLTFSLVGSAVAASACDDDDGYPKGGTGGNSAGTGGATGTGGTGTGAGTGGAAGGETCMSPVTSMQVADTTGHTHTVTLTAAQINAGSPMMFTTSNAGGHVHTVTLTAGDFTMLRGGMSITKTSSNDSNHTHSYAISCA